MKFPKNQMNESSRAHKHAKMSTYRSMKPTVRLFKSSHEISTLKENAIKNLRKELTEPKQYQFKNKILAKTFSQRMSEVYEMIYHLQGTYNVEPATYCLFDKVFRNFAMRNVSDFLQSPTEKQSVENIKNQNNVGTFDKNSTDSKLNPDFLAEVNFQES